MLQKQILTKIKEKVQSVTDTLTLTQGQMDQEIPQNVIMIACQNIINGNMGLPDYLYDISVIIDSVIPQNRSAEVFQKIKNSVKDCLIPYTYRDAQLSGIFGDLPVIFFALSNQSSSLQQNSFRSIWNFKAVTSE